MVMVFVLTLLFHGKPYKVVNNQWKHSVEAQYKHCHETAQWQMYIEGHRPNTLKKSDLYEATQMLVQSANRVKGWQQ